MDKVEIEIEIEIWLDQKGTWRTQVENIQLKCEKVISLMQ